MKNNFKKQYRDLEMRILSNLRFKINESKKHSKHINEKCIKVNIFGYTELVILNDELIFMDNNGLQYSLWNGDCSLEDLIDILNETEH